MKRWSLLILVPVAYLGVALCGATAGGQKDKEPPKDAPPPPALAIEMKLLEGTWQLVSREVDGQKDDLQNVAIRATVKDGKYTVQMGETVVEQGSFRIDPTTKPKAIDAIPETGDNKGKTILAVYDVGPEDLRMCVAPEGSKRPTVLEAKQGSGFILNAYKRQAPPKQ